MLIVALETVETVSLVSGCNDVHTSIEKELQGCDEALFALRKFQRQNSGRGQSMSDESQSFTDEVLEELADIQVKLAAYSNALNTHNANIIRYVLFRYLSIALEGSG